MSNLYFFFFFFNDTATTEIYTLSLHDALPIYDATALVALRTSLAAAGTSVSMLGVGLDFVRTALGGVLVGVLVYRSEEHTSELQSRQYLVCRLLLEKKKKEKNVKWIVINRNST